MDAPHRNSKTARERAAGAAAGRGRPLGATTDDQIDDGELIAAAAVRLTVKNELLIRALGRGESYDPAALAAAVRKGLRALANEKADNVERIAAVRRSIRHWRMPHKRRGYGRADLEILERRQEIDAGLSSRLRRLSEDKVYAAGVVAAARDAALDEIARSIRDKAGSLYSLGMIDENYRQERRERMCLLLTDLSQLGRARSASAAADDVS